MARVNRKLHVDVDRENSHTVLLIGEVYGCYMVLQYVIQYLPMFIDYPINYLDDSSAL